MQTADRQRLFLGLVIFTTATAVINLWSILADDGFSALDTVFLGVFTVLFAWIGSAFWMACLGAYARFRRVKVCPIAVRDPDAGMPTTPPSGSRTAIVMPVYNEDIPRLFAGVRSICESLHRAAPGRRFDFYVLSDSSDPEQWIAEELEWFRLRTALGEDSRLFYRHRSDNKGRKSGNIAEFCTNWGSLYDYMLVLDADSLMTGGVVHELVRLMDANPRVALIQVTPELINRDSLFARIHQFAASVYSPIYAAGLCYLQGLDGNYWGHNAIVRLRPFIENCGLPRLSGRPPLGGEIMSHDFVEAALLRRAGWEVWLAPDLGGSYEEAPPTLLDHLKRERRWCQGNLQHFRLIFAKGFRAVSRVHLAVGVMTYASSLLWFLMLLLSAVEALRIDSIKQVHYVGRYPVFAWPPAHTAGILMLVFAMVGLLYVPKFLAYLVLMRDPVRRRAHGGPLAAGLGVLLESLFSTLLAPIMMLSHSWFVISILLGRSTEWRVQERSDRGLTLLSSARILLPHTLVALMCGVAAYVYIPESFWWFVPVLVGPVLSIPFCRFTSSPRLGVSARRRGLFVVPTEASSPPIARRVAELVGKRRTTLPAAREGSSLARLALEDPFVNALHTALIGESSTAAISGEHAAYLVRTVHESGLDAISTKERMLILADAELVSALYTASWSRRAWRRLAGRRSAAGPARRGSASGHPRARPLAPEPAT